MTSTAVSRCKTCSSQLPHPDAQVCLRCGAPQTGVARWVARWTAVLPGMKLLATALILPVTLAVITAMVTHHLARREQAERRYDEMVSSIAQMQAATTGLYEPCVGEQVEDCTEHLQEQASKYVAASTTLQHSISRNFPDLSPTALLLASLDQAVVREADQRWTATISCRRGGGDAAFCAAERRREPIMSLAAANFLVDYIRCATENRFAQEQGREPSEYCWAIEGERRDVAYSLPAKFVNAFADQVQEAEADEVVGPHLYRIPWDSISDIIIKAYILPGSGLQHKSDTVSGPGG